MHGGGGKDEYHDDAKGVAHISSMAEGLKLNIYKNGYPSAQDRDQRWLELPENSIVHVYQGGHLYDAILGGSGTAVTLHAGGRASDIQITSASTFTVEDGGKVGEITGGAESTINLHRCTADNLTTEGTLNLYGAVSGSTEAPVFKLAKALNICAALGDPQSVNLLPIIDIKNDDNTLKWEGGVFTSGWSTYMSTATPGDYLQAASGYQVAKAESGELCCEKKGHEGGEHPACGTACTHNGSHAELTWTSVKTWSEFGASGAALALTDCSYVLAADMTATKDSVITVTGTVNLCLNGNTLNLNGGHFVVKSGAVLNLCDCTGVGKMTKGSDSVIKLESGAKANLFSGTIADSKAELGGAVYVPANATFTMYGGTLLQNYAHTTAKGGAVYVTGGSFEMNGGTINGNYTNTNSTQATGLNSGGGAVYVDGSGTFTLNGGTITGNTAGRTHTDYSGDFGGCGVRVFSGTFTMTGGTFTKQGDAVQVDAGGKFYFNGGTMGDGAACRNCYYSGSTRGRSSQIIVMGGTASMNGGTIQPGYGSVYVLSGSFTMEKGLIADFVNVTGGTFTMKNGEIGRGIYVDGGDFTMHDGTIGSLASDTGDNCIIYNGTFTMKDGCVTTVCDGVLVRGGIFNMESGAITGTGDNTRYGLVVRKDATLNMKSGEISGYDFGLYVNSGANVDLSGTVKIANNTMTYNGYTNKQNLYLRPGATVNIGNLNAESQIGVTMDDSTGVFTVGGNASIARFFADDPHQSISASGSNLQLTGTCPKAQPTKSYAGGQELTELRDNKIYLEVGQSIQLGVDFDSENVDHKWIVFYGENATVTSTGLVTGTKVVYNGPEVDKSDVKCTYNEGRNSVSFYIYVTEPANRTVTYEMQGHGTQISPLTTPNKQTMTAPTAPTATGYTFLGWYKDAACTTAWDFKNDIVADNLTLYAGWAAKSYPMALDVNGGTCTSDTAFFTFGQPYGELPTPTRTGYDFSGWFDAADNQITSTATLDHEIAATQAARTLTARWTATPATPATVTPGENLTLTYGYAQAGSIAVTAAAAPGHTISAYQWYQCTDAEKTSPTLLSGEASASYEVPTGLPAGTTYYYCTVTTTRTDNGETATADSSVITVTVSRGTLTANVAMQSYTYGDSVPTPTVENQLGTGAVTFYYSNENSNSGGTQWENITSTTLSAGTYYLYAVIASDGNYESFTTPAVAFTVSKAAATVTAWPTISPIYVGDILTDAALEGGTGDGTFAITGTTTWAESGANTTEVTFTPANANYEPAVNSGVSVTVQKRTAESITTVLSSITDKPYGTSLADLGLPETLSVLASGNKTLTVPVTWSGYDAHLLTEQTLTGTLDFTTLAQEVEQPDPAMTTTVTVTLQAGTPGAVTFSDKSATYTGSPITHTIDPLPGGVASISYAYTGASNTGEQYSSATAPTDAGSYQVTATFTMLPGFSQLGETTAALTITRAPQTIHVPTGSTITRGSSEVDISAWASAEGTLTYALTSQIEGVTLTGTSLTVLETVAEGTVISIEATAAETCNYSSATESFSVTVTSLVPASVTTVPTAEELTYNGSPQVLVVAGMAQNGTMQYRLGDTGDYTTELPTAQAADTYTVWYRAAGDGVTYCDSEAASIKVTISPKSLTDAMVTLPAASVTFTGSAITNAPVVTDAAALTEDTDYTVLYANNVTVGTATVTVTGIGNYTGTVTKTFEIVSASPEPSVPGNPAPSEPSVPSTPTPPAKPEQTVTTLPGGNTATTEKTEEKTTITVASSTGEKIAEITLPATPEKGKDFTDVPSGSWYQQAIAQATAYGLFGGVTDSTFEPKSGMTRAMLAQSLYNLSGKTGYGAGSSNFSDTTGWYQEAVNWAAGANVISGTGNGKFDPHREITREQLAVMLYHYAAAIGASGNATADLSRFPDSGSVSDWAAGAMRWAVANGLINGSKTSTGVELNPRSTATRAEVATVLAHFVEFLK